MKTLFNPSCNCCGGGGCAAICVKVTNCASAAIPGATVAISQSGTTLETLTTDFLGDACSGNLAAGTYTVTITAPSCVTLIATATVVCGAGNTMLTEKLDPSGTVYGVCLQVWGCGSDCCESESTCAEPTVTAALTFAGTGVGSQTSSGLICFNDLPSAGVYTYSVSSCGYVTATGTVTLTTCGGNSDTACVALVLDSGYTCPGCPGVDTPLPETVTLTDANGAHSLVLGYLAGSINWGVCYSAPVSNLFACTGADIDPTSGSISVQWVVFCTTDADGNPIFQADLRWWAVSCGPFGGPCNLYFWNDATGCADLKPGGSVGPMPACGTDNSCAFVQGRATGNVAMTSVVQCPLDFSGTVSAASVVCGTISSDVPPLPFGGGFTVTV